MTTRDEIRAKGAGANLCYVIDRNGKHWICPVGVDMDSKLEERACYTADEMIYDRMFGG